MNRLLAVKRRLPPPPPPPLFTSPPPSSLFKRPPPTTPLIPPSPWVWQQRSFGTKSIEKKALKGKFLCPVCDRKCNSPTAVKEHMEMDHEDHVKDCTESCGCGIPFLNKKEKKEYQESKKCVACEYPSMGACRKGEAANYRNRREYEETEHSRPKCISILEFLGEKLNNGGRIMNVLDVGWGLASFGAYLLPLNIIAMSLAPNDVHENQTRFALERGIPVTLGVLGTRLLRPGGYFVYSSPEAYAHDVENRKFWNSMYDLLRRMCWRVVARREQTVIWAKPLSNSYYKKTTPGTHPPLCSSDDDPAATWNVLMKACITLYSAMVQREAGRGLEPWLQRLTTSPRRLGEIGISVEELQKDTNIWHCRVDEYWKQMVSVIHSFRNVMDKNSNIGGFSAALKDKDVWVINVAPVNASARLKIIYDRGLIGTVHDWCESFLTYPRTYDLLHHAWSVFSEIKARGYSSEEIEMDPMLRPEGFVIIGDKASVINHVRKFLASLKWDGWSSEVEPSKDTLSTGEERDLIATIVIGNF